MLSFAAILKSKHITRFVLQLPKGLILNGPQSTSKHVRGLSITSIRLNNDAQEDFDETKDVELGAFENFDISEQTITKLKGANIDHLFSVQYDTFDHIKEGGDSIVQARTGTGKTLAFALPILESLHEKDEIGRKAGRAPSVLTLAPTRELALQIHKEFLKFKSRKINVSCFYGGTPYYQQEEDLHNGIDILIGTPGRILDHIGKGTLDCSKVKHVILDEADRMMDMGFQKDLDEILSNAYTPRNKPQTLLFSATVPPWVTQTAKKYLSDDMKHFDLIGSSVNKSAVTVEHISIKCSFWERAAVIKDLMQVYSGKYGKTIIFTATKNEANRLSTNSVIGRTSKGLHGDISQAQREITLEGFRNGKFNCLVATDVASRGLDIPEVDLVIQTEPPADLEHYIHRAGRTGRAGRNGVCIVFYEEGQEEGMQAVENRAGISFTRIGPPQQRDIFKASADDAIRSINKVHNDVIAEFISSAKELIESRGAENALAAALAQLTGTSKFISRSMLTSKQGFTTYVFKVDENIHSKARMQDILEYYLDESLTNKISNMTLCKDKKGCVFDVPVDKVGEISKWKALENVTLECVKELPELTESIKQSKNFGSNHQGSGSRTRYSGYNSFKESFDNSNLDFKFKKNNSYAKSNYKNNQNQMNNSSRNNFNNQNNSFNNRNNSFNNRNNNFNNRNNDFNNKNSSLVDDDGDDYDNYYDNDFSGKKPWWKNRGE